MTNEEADKLVKRCVYCDEYGHTAGEHDEIKATEGL